MNTPSLAEIFDSSATPERIYKKRDSEYISLVIRLGKMEDERRAKHARKLQKSAQKMATLLINKDDIGVFFPARRQFDKKTGIEISTLGSFPHTASVLGNKFLHIISHRSTICEDERAGPPNLAHEFYVSDDKEFNLDNMVRRNTDNPNYNYVGKIAGLWVDNEGSGLSTGLHPVAVLHEAHQTLASVFELLEIDTPQGFYRSHEKALKPPARLY